MRTIFIRFLALALTVYGTSLSVSAQSGQAAAPQTRRLTVDEAVKIALENNLGVQVARIDPLIQDLGIAQARGAWNPSLSTTVQRTRIDSPNNSFLSGAQGTTLSDGRFNTHVGVNPAFEWGGRYSSGWDSRAARTPSARRRLVAGCWRPPARH